MEAAQVMDKKQEELKNNDLEKWTLEVAKKINREGKLKNVYFTSQRKLLHLKQKMRRTLIRNK